MFPGSIFMSSPSSGHCPRFRPQGCTRSRQCHPQHRQPEAEYLDAAQALPFALQPMIQALFDGTFGKAQPDFSSRRCNKQPKKKGTTDAQTVDTKPTEDEVKNDCCKKASDTETCPNKQDCCQQKREPCKLSKQCLFWPPFAGHMMKRFHAQRWSEVFNLPQGFTTEHVRNISMGPGGHVVFKLVKSEDKGPFFEKYTTAFHKFKLPEEVIEETVRCVKQDNTTLKLVGMRLVEESMSEKEECKKDDEVPKTTSCSDDKECLSEAEGPKGEPEDTENDQCCFEEDQAECVCEKEECLCEGCPEKETQDPSTDDEEYIIVHPEEKEETCQNKDCPISEESCPKESESQSTEARDVTEEQQPEVECPDEAQMYSTEPQISHACEEEQIDATDFPTITESMTIAEDEDKPNLYQTTFQMSAFQPEDITLKLHGHRLSVDAVHVEDEGDGNKIDLQMHRTIDLPEDVDTEQIRSIMKENGDLIVQAPFLQSQPRERSLKIELN